MSRGEPLEGVERDGGKLVLRWNNDQKARGVVCFGIGLALLLDMHMGWHDYIPHAILPLFATMFFGLGIYNVLPHTVTTIFDTQTQLVHQVRSIGGRWCKSTRVFSFADIASIGFDQYAPGEPFVPVIRLKDGTSVAVSVSSDKEIDADPIRAVVAATGLQRKDELP
jgi:hypothetical protein